MQYRFIPYLWVSLTLTIILLLLIRFALKRYAEKGVPYFLFALILSTVWVISQAMEISAVDLSSKTVWANLTYIPSTLAPVAYFYLALFYLGLEKRTKKRWLLAFLIFMPLMFNVLVWTNDYHGLIRQNIYLDTSGAFPVVGKTYGPIFRIYAVYNSLLSFVTMIILGRGLYINENKLQKVQIVSLLTGLLLPTISVLVFILKVFPLKIDPTPITIGVSAIIISWSILRYHLFDVVSFAHSMIIKEMCTGMIILDNMGSVLEINPAAQNMLNISLPKPPENSVDLVLNSYPGMIDAYKNQVSKTNEIFIKTESGINYCEVSLKQLNNSNDIPVGWIYQIYDVTRRKLEEDKIKELATHDVLTGLINRTYFEKVFSGSLEAAKMSGISLAVAYLDLDDFKNVNDSFGHDAGDVLLREVSDRLKAVLKGSGIVSRYGGDEFAVLFPSVDGQKTLDNFACAIGEELEKHIEYDGLQIPIRASIGFSIFPQDGDSLDELIKTADKAMYEKKRSNKLAYVVH